MNYAIILSGGIGSRLWPLSSRKEPKQFLNICSAKSTLEETLRRIGGLIKNEHIYIATNRLHVKKIKGCTKKSGIPKENFLFEPKGKNTLAPIGVLSHRISLLDSDAVVVVLPCDHLIRQRNKFLRLLAKAINVAGDGFIVTLGIRPTRPETDYGYIKVKSKIKHQKSKIYKVKKFIEKPRLSKAKRLIKDKGVFWNSGMFVFKASAILEEIKKYVPDAYNIIKQIRNKQDLKRLWHRFPSISLDYGVMEKTKKAALLPADFGWVDLGSWRAVAEIMKKDKNGNIFKGKCIDIGTKDSFVWSDKGLVATLGLNNIIIVDTKDSLLVCSKDKAGDVKKLIGS